MNHHSKLDFLTHHFYECTLLTDILEFPHQRDSCSSPKLLQARTLVIYLVVRFLNLWSSIVHTVSNLFQPSYLFAQLQLGVPLNQSIYYNLLIEITTLSNGIRVATEKTLNPTATVGVYVGAGSRNDTLPTSGASHVLRHMITRGTANRSRANFNEEVDSLGARLLGESGRE